MVSNIPFSPNIINTDCAEHTEDPLCKNEVLKDLPIVGAGHHVRAKTNVPVIGILTQPIPSTQNGDSHRWMDEFERIKKLGAAVVAEPYPPAEDPKMMIATFADPDNNYFQLVTPMEIK